MANEVLGSRRKQANPGTWGPSSRFICSKVPTPTCIKALSVRDKSSARVGNAPAKPHLSISLKNRRSTSLYRHTTLAGGAVEDSELVVSGMFPRRDCIA
jgi:hypothetical protein